MSTVQLRSPVNALASFHYFRTVDMAELASLGLRIIGDCGAYSAFTSGKPIDRDEFFEWAIRWRSSLFWVASLDVAYDKEATYANWIARPDSLSDLVPTIHYPDVPSVMDRYVEGGADLIGMGGMVPFKAEPKRLLRWCLTVMRYARDRHPHVRFHGWGITHPLLMQNLPWWSVDTSGFGSGYRFGRLQLFDPARAKMVTVPCDGRSPAKHSRLLAGSYGVDWRDVLTAGPHNRALLVRIGMRSMQLLEAFLQSRHNVSPPKSLAVDVSGPQVHFADTSTSIPFEAGPFLHYAEGSVHRFQDGGPYIHSAHATHPKDWKGVRS